MNSRRFERTHFRSAAAIREAILIGVIRNHNSLRAFCSSGNASLALILPLLVRARWRTPAHCRVSSRTRFSACGEVDFELAPDRVADAPLHRPERFLVGLPSTSLRW